METVKNWAFSVCCASIFGGILNYILSDGGVQKIYKTVFCVFFLCILISPVSDIDFSKITDFKLSNMEQYKINFEENEFNQNSVEYLKNEIFYSTKEILDNENLDFDDISIKINILEDGSINITKFALTFKNLEDPGSLIKKIQQKTGLAPEIIISGEN